LLRLEETLSLVLDFTLLVEIAMSDSVAEFAGLKWSSTLLCETCYRIMNLARTTRTGVLKRISSLGPCARMIVILSNAGPCPFRQDTPRKNS